MWRVAASVAAAAAVLSYLGESFTGIEASGPRLGVVVDLLFLSQGHCSVPALSRSGETFWHEIWGAARDPARTMRAVQYRTHGPESVLELVEATFFSQQLCAEARFAFSRALGPRGPAF